MSLPNPLVVAFSESQLKSSIQTRVNLAESAHLYLRREGVVGPSELSPFLKESFYLVADTKRALFNEVEISIDASRKGLQELDYIVSGQIALVRLTDEQREVIEDIGLTTRQPVIRERAAALV